MAEKRRYTVTLPDHVADAVESRAKPLGATPTEYTADVVRWWFGQGCPPVTGDEEALRKKAASQLGRIEALPDNLTIWTLDPKKIYNVGGDEIVQEYLNQLGLPNLFAGAQEYEKARLMIAFDNHPTHWIEFNLFKGGKTNAKNGLLMHATPKVDFSRDEMLKKLRGDAKAMGADRPVTFSQIPMLESMNVGNLTATKAKSGS
jgi:hypothetical protein